MDGMLGQLLALLQVMHDSRLSRSKLDQLVQRRLRKVLVSAYLHVPYYRETMRRADYDPRRDYSGPEDLRMLPVTTKTDVKERNTAAFVKEGTDLSRCFWDASSGSTGIPLTTYRNPHERAMQIAKWLRVLLLNGYSGREKVMSLSSLAKHPGKSIVMEKFGPLRRLVVSFRLAPERMVDLFLDYQPDVLWGARTLLDLMALELMRRGVQPKPLKVVVGAAEAVRASSRRLCQEVFGTEMLEVYGSVEMGGNIAYETRAHDGLHLCEDLVYFEFLDEHGEPVPPGKPGRVVLTDLVGDVMPFIRYDQGDWAVFEQASVESNGRRRITRIVGRDSDVVQLPDGTRHSFHGFSDMMEEFEEVRQFRVVQKTRELFHILVVADPTYLAGIREGLMQKLRGRLPPPVLFEIVLGDRLEPDPSGKLRLLVSEIDSED